MEEYIIKEKPRQIMLVAIVAVSIFMYTLDYSMVVISLPTIAKSLGVKLVTAAWIPLAYMLVITSSLLGFGKLGDIRGYKKIFILGLAFFLIGTILCGLSNSIRLLVSARIVQSFGEAIFSPIAIALVTTFLPSNIKGRALGVVAMAQGLGFSAGSMLGGAITNFINWHAIFFVNVPTCILVFIFALKVLPSKQVLASDKRFDIVGAILMFTALATLVFALNAVIKLGFRNPVIMWCGAVSLVSFAAFIILENKIKFPVLDLGLFRNRNFAFSNLAVFFALCAFMGFIFLLPFYLEMIKGMKVAETGLYLMIPSFAMMALAPLAGHISDKIGSRLLCSLGMVIAILGIAACLATARVENRLFLAAALFLLGSAMGVFLAPNNKIVMASASVDKQGVASGVYKTIINTGGIVGVAVMPIVVMKSSAFLIEGFRHAFLSGMALCAIALVFSILTRDNDVA